MGAVAAFGVLCGVLGLRCRESPSLGCYCKGGSCHSPVPARASSHGPGRPTLPVGLRARCLGTPSRLLLWLHSLFPVSAGLEIALFSSPPAASAASEGPEQCAGAGGRCGGPTLAVGMLVASAGPEPVLPGPGSPRGVGSFILPPLEQGRAGQANGSHSHSATAVSQTWEFISCVVLIFFLFVCFFFSHSHSKRPNNSSCFFFPWLWMEPLVQPPLRDRSHELPQAPTVPELLCLCHRAWKQLCSPACSEILMI